jgi:single-stranded DNA-binding protein
MPFSATVNRAFLLGRIADEPVWNQKGNKRVCCFNLATTEEIRKGDATLEHIEMHHVVIPSEIAGDGFFRVGEWVYIQGKIQTRPVFEDGIKMYRTEIWSTNIELLKMRKPATDIQYDNF